MASLAFQTAPTGGSVLGKCEAVCVDPKKVDEVWPHVRHFIQEALKRGDLGLFESLEADVLWGDALLWLAWDDPNIEAAAVTQLVRTEQGTVCMIHACGGSRHRRWIGLIEKIEAYAKAEGCKATRLMGRRGWQRVLKNYSETKVILERRL